MPKAMATSHDDNSSSMDRPAQLYQRNLGRQPSHPSVAPAMFEALSDSIVVTTMSSSTVAGSSLSTSSLQPGIEGRVGKPARRRSRASRRAPTTLLNTDTTNFRAMVQQFTGITSGPYSSGYPAAGAGAGVGGPIVSYGLNFSEPQMMLFGQGRPQEHQFEGLPYRPQQQYQQSEGMFGLGVSSNGNGNGGGNNNNKNDEEDNNDNNHAFLLGFNNSGTNLEVAEDFYFDGIPTQMMPRPTSTNNRTDGYFS